MSVPGFSVGVRTSSKILQPHLSRFRNRYKGVRESAKLNLFSHQFYTDIHFLRAIVSGYLANKSLGTAFYGTPAFVGEVATFFETVFSHWDSDEATPDSDTPILEVAQNAYEHRAAIASIESRLNRLERM